MRKLLLLLLLPIFAFGQTRQSGGISFTPQWNYKIAAGDTTWQFGNTLMSPQQFPYLLTKWQSDQRYAPFGGGVTSFNMRTGAVSLLSTDVNNALGYLAENVTNKAASFVTVNNSLYPTVRAVFNYAQPINANLTSIAALANSSGVLTNNGSGSFSYVAPSSGSVTSLTDNTANGVAITWTNRTTTPTPTVVLGAITPTSTNGVSATTMAFNDATSSIQTQLNAKSPSVTYSSNTIYKGNGTTTPVVSSITDNGSTVSTAEDFSAGSITANTVVSSHNISIGPSNIFFGGGSANDGAVYVAGGNKLQFSGSGNIDGQFDGTGAFKVFGAAKYNAGRPLSSLDFLYKIKADSLYAPITSGTGYINNTTSVQSSSNFNIDGLGTITKASIGTTPTDAMLLTNTTAATVGAQKISPSLHFNGNAWNTTGSASESSDFYNYLVPVQGTTPTANLLWRYARAGGGLTTAMTLNSAGNLTLPGTLLVNSNATIGSVGVSSVDLEINKNITGGTTSQGVRIAGQIQSDVTAGARIFASNVTTQATAFTLASVNHFYASGVSIGAGSTVTEQNGFLVANNLTTATNNYGFRATLSSATGIWNGYSDGTAPWYINGNLLLGSSTSLFSAKFETTGLGVITKMYSGVVGTDSIMVHGSDGRLKVISATLGQSSITNGYVDLSSGQTISGTKDFGAINSTAVSLKQSGFFLNIQPPTTLTGSNTVRFQDAGGTVALTSQLPIHGNSTTTGTATTAVTVTIGSTMANTTYNTTITPRYALTAVNYYVSAQTTTTFTVTFLTALTGSINFDYNITP